MLSVFVTSVVIVGASMGAMALGVVVRGRPLGHGCGEATACDACRRPCASREAGEEATWSAR